MGGFTFPGDDTDAAFRTVGLREQLPPAVATDVSEEAFSAWRYAARGSVPNVAAMPNEAAFGYLSAATPGQQRELSDILSCQQGSASEKSHGIAMIQAFSAALTRSNVDLQIADVANWASLLVWCSANAASASEASISKTRARFFARIIATLPTAEGGDGTGYALLLPVSRGATEGSAPLRAHRLAVCPFSGFP